MIKMRNPSGGVTLIHESRMAEYTAEGFKPFALPIYDVAMIDKDELKAAVEAEKNANIKPIKAKTKKATSVGITTKKDKK